MKTKICGIRDERDAQIAIEAKADALGFLVGITHLAEDKITQFEAKKIIEKYRLDINTVLVTHLQNENDIIELAEYLNTTALQIHDYVPAHTVKRIKTLLPSTYIIKALHVTTLEKTIMQYEEFKNVVDALLLDSISPGRIGGTGKTHNWDISREIAMISPVPVILAGGLTPENVGDAVRIVKPYAVDVNSGVETNGFKDINKIKSLIEHANEAERISSK